jgi:hypothetical protein
MQGSFVTVSCTVPKLTHHPLKVRRDQQLARVERIVLLDFIHRLVSQKTNKIEELKI